MLIGFGSRQKTFRLLLNIIQLKNQFCGGARNLPFLLFTCANDCIGVGVITHI